MGGKAFYNNDEDGEAWYNNNKDGKAVYNKAVEGAVVKVGVAVMADVVEAEDAVAMEELWAEAEAEAIANVMKPTQN